MTRPPKSISIFLILVFLVGVFYIAKPQITDLLTDNPIVYQTDLEEIFNPVIEGKQLEYFSGYNMFVLESRNENVFSTNLIITDMDGKVQYNQSVKKKLRDLSDMGAEFINTTTIMLGDEDSLILHNIETNATQRIPVNGHHEYEYNPLRNSFFTFEQYERDNLILDRIVEYNIKGELIWFVDSFDLIPPTALQRGFLAGPGTDDNDITHGNSIFFDADERVLYVNFRHLNTFYKINYTSGEKIWALGQYGDFDLIDKTGNSKDTLFIEPHAVEPVGGNKFILMDNNYRNQSLGLVQYTRLMEIMINEDTMVAQTVWDWVAPPEYYMPFWGDADRLPNGNTFGTFGAPRHPNSDIGARLVEVNQNNEIVWEMNFPNKGGMYGIYRAERFRFEPIVESQEKLTVSPFDNVTVDWQVWYNYRTKIEKRGSYELLVDGNIIERDQFIFGKYWQVQSLNTRIGQLSSGLHNVTLAVFDEDGNMGKSEMTIEVIDFLVNQIGPTEIEKGQMNSILSWQGISSSQVIIQLDIDNNILFNSSWNGNFSLDLNDFEIGTYELRVQFYNKTYEFFETNLILNIQFPQAPLLSMNDGVSVVEWNQTGNFEFLVDEISPQSYQIYLNSSLIYEQNDDLGENFVWEFRLLIEGYYEGILTVVDYVGFTSSLNFSITVTPSSIPTFIQVPTNLQVNWGTDDMLIIDVKGSNYWVLVRNDDWTISGNIVNDTIVIKFKWQFDDWNIDIFILELTIFNEYNGGQETVTFYLDVVLMLGDDYANLFVQAASLFVENGNNALGAPDSNTATIFAEYGPGYIVLDMGLGEEIVDLEGADLEIIISGGFYNLFSSPDDASQFTFIATLTGNQQIDLSEYGIRQIRFLRIEYSTGNFLELDAVVGLYTNAIGLDVQLPIIPKIEDIVVNQAMSIDFQWEVAEQTPWSYQILINGILEVSSKWNGSIIEFTKFFDFGFYKLEIIVYDLFLNEARDTIDITVDNPDFSYSVIIIEDEQNHGRGIEQLLSNSIFWLSIVTISSTVVFLLGRKKFNKSKQV